MVKYIQEIIVRMQKFLNDNNVKMLSAGPRVIIHRNVQTNVASTWIEDRKSTHRTSKDKSEIL